MNNFRYVIGQSVDFASNLDYWFLKAQGYINLYFDENRENVRNTPFGDCISKIRFLSNLLREPEQGFTIDDFRGVVTRLGTLLPKYKLKHVKVVQHR